MLLNGLYLYAIEWPILIDTLIIPSLSCLEFSPMKKQLPKSPIWLRDHCRCQECFHPITKQRLVDVYSKDLEIKNYTETVKELRIEWKDGHLSTYPSKMFQSYQSPVMDYKYWDSSLIVKPVDYQDIMFGNGLKRWVQNIHEYGIGFVENVPQSAQATKELAEKLTLIRHTHYGGFWESTADLSID